MFVRRRATRWLFPIFFKMGNYFLFKEILRAFGTPLVICLQVSKSMLVYAYLILGVISASACVGSYAWVYIDHGLSMKDLVFTADRYWSDSSGDFCPHGIHPALNGTCNCTTLMDIEQHNSTTHYDCFTSLQQVGIISSFGNIVH